jgi:hypothetical protein
VTSPRIFRRLATLAATSALLLALGASPASAAGSPLTRWSMPAADLGSLCGYTFTSGAFTSTFRTADVVVDPGTGDAYIPAAHLTFDHAVAVDGQGVSYRVLGSETYNDLKGHLTSKLLFVGQRGGAVANINVVLRTYKDGTVHLTHDRGTCSFS